MPFLSDEGKAGFYACQKLVYFYVQQVIAVFKIDPLVDGENRLALLLVEVKASHFVPALHHLIGHIDIHFFRAAQGVVHTDEIDLGYPHYTPPMD